MGKLGKGILRKFLSPKVTAALKKWNLDIQSRLRSHDLTKLATLHETDKWNFHWYVRHYDNYFSPLRKKRLSILEIGVGGYQDPQKGGASLQMWKYYFPKSVIYSIDIYDKHLLEEKRIKIFKGSQNDEKFLTEITGKTGPLDIVIDDGSHINQDVIAAFKTLFPFLKPGGIYAVEDTQTSYWPDYGGDSDDLNNPETMMGFFKNLADGLNHAEFKRPYAPTYFDREIEAVHFYHNMVFLFKTKKMKGNVV